MRELFLFSFTMYTKRTCSQLIQKMGANRPIRLVFHNLFSCLIPKRKIENIVWESSYSKIDFKVKDFLNKINYKKSLISHTVYVRRHLTLFTNCHFLWDTLYINQSINHLSNQYFINFNQKHQSINQSINQFIIILVTIIPCNRGYLQRIYE